MNIVAIIGILIGIGIMIPTLLKKLKGNTYTYGVNATYLGYDVEEEDANGLSKRISLKFRYNLFEKEYEVKCKKTYILSLTQFEAFFTKNGLKENEKKFIYVNPMKPADCSLVGGSASSPLPIYIGGSIVAVCLIFGIIVPGIGNATKKNATDDFSVAETVEDDDVKKESVSDNDSLSADASEDEDSDVQKGSAKNAKRPSTDTMVGVIEYAASYTDSPKRDEEETETMKKGNDGIVKGEGFVTTSDTSINREFVSNYLSVSENAIAGVGEDDFYSLYAVFCSQMKNMLLGDSYSISVGTDYSQVFADAGAEGTAKSMGYVRKDLDQDGVDELLFGEGKSEGGVIYDIYTIKDDKVVQLLIGDKDNQIYLCKNGLIQIISSVSETQKKYTYLIYHKGSLYLHKVLYYDESKPEKERWSYSVDTSNDISTSIGLTNENADMILERYGSKQTSFAGFVD